MAKPEPSTYKQRMFTEDCKAEIISNAKLLYGQKYPDGHDWALHFSYKSGLDEQGFRGRDHKAFVVIYTTRNSFGDRVVPIATPYCPSKEVALGRLVELMRMEVNEYFELEHARE